MSPRSLFQRICVVLGLFSLSAYLFYIGKGHTLLLDTGTMTIDGKELRSYASAIVKINGGEPGFSMGRGERVMVTVGGPKHKIVIADDSGVAEKIERTFMIPTFMDMAVVSVPAILADAPREHWVTRFVPVPVEDAPVEQMHYQND